MPIGTPLHHFFQLIPNAIFIFCLVLAKQKRQHLSSTFFHYPTPASLAEEWGVEKAKNGDLFLYGNIKS